MFNKNHKNCVAQATHNGNSFEEYDKSINNYYHIIYVYIGIYLEHQNIVCYVALVPSAPTNVPQGEGSHFLLGGVLFNSVGHGRAL